MSRVIDASEGAWSSTSMADQCVIDQSPRMNRRHNLFSARQVAGRHSTRGVSGTTFLAADEGASRHDGHKGGVVSEVTALAVAAAAVRPASRVLIELVREWCAKDRHRKVEITECERSITVTGRPDNAQDAKKIPEIGRTSLAALSPIPEERSAPDERRPESVRLVTPLPSNEAQFSVMRSAMTTGTPGC